VSDSLEALVVGAGVVGLAIGRELAQEFGAVCVVDRHRQIGFETSSRNSEVLHAGLYYEPGSLKAVLCREGLAFLRDYCSARNIPHSFCGKLIVASGTKGKVGLEKIEQLARANGVETLQWMNRESILQREPEIRADLGLFSPETGIIDSHALMTAYEADISIAGGFVAFGHKVTRVERNASGFRVWFEGMEEPVETRRLVNAAGLHSDKLAGMIEGLDDVYIPTLRYARGVYFAMQGNAQPFRHLVYPLPDHASLGVHATIDLSGLARFGPDVEWIDDPNDYKVDAAREAPFRASIAEYFPSIATRELIPAYAGIRPKLSGPGESAADFRIDGKRKHGITGLVNLFGIESPGLTASPALAKRVMQCLV
jgi:L-2-hydroxyglutarate oxidase LhgO